MKHTIEQNRAQSARQIGRKHTEATKEKMKGKDNRPFPPKCILCMSRDLDMCAKYNMRCFDAKEIVCFRRYMQRKEHPDYIKRNVGE